MTSHAAGLRVSAYWRALGWLLLIPFWVVIMGVIAWDETTWIAYRIGAFLFLVFGITIYPSLLSMEVATITSRRRAILRMFGSLSIAFSLIMMFSLSAVLAHHSNIPEENLKTALGGFLAIAGIFFAGVASYRWFSNRVFRVPNKYAAIDKTLRSAIRESKRGNPKDALILADQAMEDFLRYLCERLGCTEYTTIGKKGFDAWGFREYVQWLGEQEKPPFTETELMSLLKYRRWRNALQHHGSAPPDKSEIRKAIRFFGDFIDRNL